MKKALKAVLIAAVALTVGGAGSVTANAATWHKGTPKALRGKYQKHRTSSAEGFGESITITPKKITISVSNLSGQYVSRLKYKKIGSHLYRLKGHMAHNGMVLARNVDYAAYRKGKKFSYTDYTYYKKSGFSKYDKAKKVTHFKENGPIIK